MLAYKPVMLLLISKLSKVNCESILVENLRLRHLKVSMERTESYPLMGLGRGGQNIRELKQSMATTIELVAQVATLQIQCHEIQRLVRATNRRVNGIKYKILPHLETALAALLERQEELELEETYRRKLIKKNKSSKTLH